MRTLLLMCVLLMARHAVAGTSNVAETVTLAMSGGAEAVTLATTDVDLTIAPVQPAEVLTCKNTGCPKNRCQENLPVSRPTMRVCHARQATSDAPIVFALKTIPCSVAQLYPIGVHTGEDEAISTDRCPGVDELDCRCKTVPVTKTPSESSTVAPSTEPASEHRTLPAPPRGPCEHGGWNCATVTSTDGTHASVEHTETTSIEVSIVHPVTGKVLVPAVCTSMNCKMQICASAQFFGLDSSNQTLVIRDGPEPACGLRDVSQEDDFCTNMPGNATATLTCSDAWYGAPAVQGPNDWTRVVRDDDDDEANIVRFCRAAELREWLDYCKNVVRVPPATLKLSITAEIRSPIVTQNLSSTMCPDCKSGVCCDVATHRTQQDIQITISRAGSTPTLRAPDTSLQMQSTILDTVIDQSASACIVFATLVNAPAVLQEDPDIISSSPATQFEVTYLGPCTEGGLERTCQKWMACTPWRPQAKRTCVDAALAYAIAANNVQSIRARADLHLCVPAANSSTLTGDQAAQNGLVSITVLPTVRMRTYIGLSCMDEYDGVTPVYAGDPICFDGCIQGYPEDWPNHNMTLSLASVDMYTPSKANTVHHNVFTADPPPNGAPAVLQSKRIHVNRGFRDARESLQLVSQQWDGDGKEMAPVRMAPPLGQHCVRWTQIASPNDGSNAMIEASFAINTVVTGVHGTSVVPAAPSDTNVSTVSGKKLLGIHDNDSDDHHRRHTKRKEERRESHASGGDDGGAWWQSGFGGRVGQEVQFACKPGTVRRALPCHDGFESHNGFCRDNSAVQFNCDEDDSVGERRGVGPAIGITIAVLLIAATLLICCGCYAYDYDMCSKGTARGGESKDKSGRR